MSSLPSALLVDLDGTLVDTDLLDALCQFVGKGEQGRALSVSHGLDALSARINLLSGLSRSDIEGIVDRSDQFLDHGAHALVEWARSRGTLTILHSGNVMPVLERYREKLAFDYIVGSPVRMRDGKIEGISTTDYPCPDFKLHGCREILERLRVPVIRTITIGNSLADLSLFAYCGRSRSVVKRPSEEHLGALHQHVDFVVGDLEEALRIVAQILS